MILTSMTVGEICTLITTIAGLIPAIIGLIVFLTKTIKNKNWNALREIAETAMKTAEDYAKEHPGMKGDAKLDMAMEIIQESAKSMNIVITDELCEQLKIYIKKSITWFNDMNK